MKRWLTIIPFLLLVVACWLAFKHDKTLEMADASLEMFTWDVEEVKRGYLMFLDVPFVRDNMDSVEYLTLTVAKEKSKNRPEFISIIIPDNIVSSDGINILFGNKEPENGNPVCVLFEKCNEDEHICTARITDGYLIDKNSMEKTDIFQKLLDADFIYFSFNYPDGSNKSVAVPLFSFKEQYAEL